MYVCIYLYMYICICILCICIYIICIYVYMYIYVYTHTHTHTHAHTHTFQIFSAMANIHSGRYGFRKVAHAQLASAVRVCALYYQLKGL